MLNRGPLVSRHRARSGVGEQVDEDVIGVQREEVVAGGDDVLEALLVRGQAERLHRVDPERLDDRVEHRGAHHARPPTTVQGAVHPTAERLTGFIV
jgi:hypothetical protein